jgi:hypothetical protein
MEWFGNSWEGQEIVFPSRDDQPSTTWKIGSKLAEEKCAIWPIRWITATSGPSEAWVPFECTQVGASGSEHVLKVYMQCVYTISSHRLFYADKLRDLDRAENIIRGLLFPMNILIFLVMTLKE